MSERTKKIADILHKLLRICDTKKCGSEPCPPMHNGQFFEHCHDCAYYTLSKKIDELKKEVQQNEPN